jgi:hypothetical protein
LKERVNTSFCTSVTFGKTTRPARDRPSVIVQGENTPPPTEDQADHPTRSAHPVFSLGSAESPAASSPPVETATSSQPANRCHTRPPPNGDRLSMREAKGPDQTRENLAKVRKFGEEGRMDRQPACPPRRARQYHWDKRPPGKVPARCRPSRRLAPFSMEPLVRRGCR